MAASATNPAPARRAMSLVDALEVLGSIRGDAIVVSSMSAARLWQKQSQHPLDLHYVPSSMGQAPALALGLALAQPGREVFALVGDGSLLMNLGCLVTVAASGATNLTLLVIDNGVYEVTGGQATAAAMAAVDLAAMASAARIPTVMRVDTLADWQRVASNLLAQPGPRVVVLAIEPEREDFYLPSPAEPMPERCRKLRAALT